MTEKVQISLRLSPEHVLRLDLLARSLGVSRSALVEFIAENLPAEPAHFVVLPLVRLMERFREIDTEDVLDALLRYLKRELEERWGSRRPNEVWVTELVSCRLKPELARKYPDLLRASVYSPNAVLGTLAHWGITFIARALGYDVEVPVERRVIVNSEEVIVRGRADIVAPGKVVIDLKTGRGVREAPSSHHCLQVWLYRLILGTEKAKVLYVTLSRMCSVEVTEGDVRKALDELKVSADVDDFTSLVQALMRARERRVPLWHWECSYCPFSRVCPHSRAEG